MSKYEYVSFILSNDDDNKNLILNNPVETESNTEMAESKPKKLIIKKKTQKVVNEDCIEGMKKLENDS